MKHRFEKYIYIYLEKQYKALDELKEIAYYLILQHKCSDNNKFKDMYYHYNKQIVTKVAINTK